jgi:branched-chain amino acid transport system substrate-binding protein
MACTGGSGSVSAPPAPSQSANTAPSSSPAASSPSPNSLVLHVVAATSGPQRDDHGPYVDGMRLAVDVVNATGGMLGRPLALAVHDDGGSPQEAARLIGSLISSGSPRSAAILYLGPGPALLPLRPRLERAATPMILLQGDLYTGRGLFRQVFQTTVPWEWQAKVIARYLVLDRKARKIGFIGSGEEADQARSATRQALAYWGGRLSWGIAYGSEEDPPSTAVSRAQEADAVVVFGSSSDTARLVESLADSDHPPRIAGAASLLAATHRQPSGTTACYTYTWAGWAEPIRRVRTFRERFRAAFGHDPAGLEQEGYDAIRVLALGLEETGGEGGAKLTAALEKIHDRTFSSFPIDLGPDDHLFLPRDELGLFAVAGPDERVDPWQAAGGQPWRALMRTFTYDGERTSVLDRDRRVFFPFWRKNQPGPEFFRSRYGIRSRAARDPLH